MAEQSPEPDTMDRWQRWEPKAGVIGSAATVFGLILTILGMVWTSRPSDPPAGPAISTIAEPDPGANDAHDVVSAANGPCRDAHGRGEACTATGARLITSARPCTTAAALASLGVQSGLQLDAAASSTGSVCMIRAGSLASAAGATVARLREWTTHDADPRWMVCATADANQQLQEVACSAIHTLEMVGPWQVQTTDGTATELCDTPARVYTGRTFGGINSTVKLVKLTQTISGTPRYRCAVKQHPTSGTLWHGDSQG